MNRSGLSTILPMTQRPMLFFGGLRKVEHYNPEELHRNIFFLSELLRIRIGEEAMACLWATSEAEDYKQRLT